VNDPQTELPAPSAGRTDARHAAAGNTEISTIIPAYNRHAELQRAVGSALRQTIACREVIVIDDGSVPPIAGVGELADPRVRIIRRDYNRGAAAARNLGISAARAGILAFLDSDDVWHPSKLEEQLALLDHGDLDGIVTGFDLRDRFKSKAISLIPNAAVDISEFASGCWFSPGTTLLIRKAAFEVVGPFDEALRRLEDYEWFLRFGSLGGKLTVVPKILAAIDVSSGGRPDAVNAAARIIRQAYDGRLPGAVFRRVEAFTALAEASAHIRAGQPLRAAFALARSFAAVPRTGLHLHRHFAAKLASRPDCVSGRVDGVDHSYGSTVPLNHVNYSARRSQLLDRSSRESRVRI
jgi:GT2 family glycosyltransferase